MPRQKTPRRNPHFLGQVQTLREQGLGWRDICARLNLTKTTYYRIVDDLDRLAEVLPCKTGQRGRPRVLSDAAVA